MSSAQNSPTLHGNNPIPANARAAVIYTEWNERIVAELVRGFENTLALHGGAVTERMMVPGCFELPFACRELWSKSAHKPLKPEVIVVFGAVIRGGTPHFEYVSKAVTEGVLQLNLLLPIPTIFGVLTLDNEAQGWERLGGAHGHKGEEAAIAALKMVQICRER